MKEVKIGLICVGLEGERNDLAALFLQSARENLSARGLQIVNLEDACTLTGEEVQRQSRQCEEKGADALIYLIGTWILADHVIDAVGQIRVPFAVWGVPEPASFSSVGANVVHGTLDDMEISHRLVYGRPDDGEALGEIVDFARAAAVKKKLRSCRLGVLGGKTISAYPTTADEIQIKKIFGTEIFHLDQMVLYEKAQAVADDLCEAKIAWLKETVGEVDVPPEMLRRSVSVYFALKEIIAEYALDMVTVQCIGEFMDRYTSCCLALALLNDEGYLCGCQCNINALLSAYILRTLTEKPVFFGDVNVILKEQRTARLINCGSIPLSLAPDLSKVSIVEQYAYMGEGRGACTFFCCRPGKVTFGTLGRRAGQYVMNIASGEAFTEAEEKLKEVRTWAQGFVRLDCDPLELYRNLRCNHSVVCYGEEKNTLLELCALYHIQPETTTKRDAS